jgi:hypothetical protein
MKHIRSIKGKRCIHHHLIYRDFSGHGNGNLSATSSDGDTQQSQTSQRTHIESVSKNNRLRSVRKSILSTQRYLYTTPPTLIFHIKASTPFSSHQTVGSSALQQPVQEQMNSSSSFQPSIQQDRSFESWLLGWPPKDCASAFPRIRLWLRDPLFIYS